MFNSEFKQKLPFISDFFEAAISNNASKMTHSYMLTGSDSMLQYYIAVQVAKMLNCETKEPDCKCRNCTWINQNRHPAVVTISPIDFTYTEDGAKAQGATVIKVDQARYLRKLLASSSPYHRAVIFTNASEGDENTRNAEVLWADYKEILSPPPIEQTESRKSWIPSGVNAKIFQAETANTLLKTIEEPNPGITFFFLVNDREDMLDTIVSRCQVLPVPSIIKVSPDYTRVKDILDRFPPKTPLEAIQVAEKVVEISKNEDISSEEIFSTLQEYFRHIMEENISNKPLVETMIGMINKAEKAKQEIRSFITPQNVIESFMLSIIT